MDNSDALLPFGIAIVVIAGLLIVVPFFRGKSDLLTAWNTLLFGVITFLGIASIQVNLRHEFPFPLVDWFQPTAKEVSWYMWANAAFIGALIAAYYLNDPAKKFAQKRFRKWPEVTPQVTFLVLGYCCAILVLSVLLQRITFFGPLTVNLAQMAAPAASLFSFRLWHRNRTSILWLLVFIGVFSSAALYSMVVFGGRRLLLSVFLGPLIYLYAVQMRHWSRPKVIFAIGMSVVFFLGLSAVYNKFRYYNVNEVRSTRGIIEQIRGLKKRGDFFSVVIEDPLGYLSQDTGHFALLTQRFVAQGMLQPEPLNTIRFLASYGIPRRIWAGKPDVLGVVITRDVMRFPSTNWGCGVAGQGAFEGGIPALILYGILLAFGVRLLDEPKRLQPDNPFLIYMLAAAIPHLMAIPRGDMGVMSGVVGQAVLTAIILGIVCRAIFGTQRSAVPAFVDARHPGNTARWVLPNSRINP